MSNLGQEAATFLTLAAARADDDNEQTPGPGRPPTAEDLKLTAKKVAAALIAGSLREALGPGWTRNLYHPDAVAHAASLASTTARILATTPLHRAAELAGITITDTGITAAQVPELTAHLTREAVHEHIQREGARVAAAAQDPRLVIGRGRGYIVVQHAASTLRIKFIPSIAMPGLGTVDARPYDIPVIGSDDPDTWYSYVGLGIGTRLYRAAGEQLPHIRWVTSQTTDVTTAIRRRLHAENPYRWHHEDCPWCSENLPAGWDDSDEALFLFHPRTESTITDPAGEAGADHRTPRRNTVAGLQAVRSPIRPLGRALRATGLVATGILVTSVVASLVISAGRSDQGEAALSTGPQGAVTQSPDPGRPAAGTTMAAAPSVAVIRPPSLAAAPVGFRAAPVWGLVVDPRTKVATSAQGLVYTRTPQGALVGLDAATGAVTWTASGTWGSGWDGPWTTRIDGRDVVALNNATQLVYWPRLQQTGAVQLPTNEPVTVSLPARSRVTWTGPSPLISPGVGRAAVIQGGAVTPVAMPAGVRALAADGTTVIAVRGGQWIRGVAGRTPVARTIPIPRGAKGAPSRVEAVGSQFLLAIWPLSTGGQSYILLETQAGKTLVGNTIDRSLDAIHGSVVRQLGGDTTSIGPLVVDTDRHLVHEFLAKYRIRAITPGHVIATTGEKFTDIGLTNNGFDIRPYPAAYQAVNAPFAAIKAPSASGRIGLALTSTADQWCLVALPES